MSIVAEKRKIQYWEELSKAASVIASNCSKVLNHGGNVSGNIVDGGELWYTQFPEVFDIMDEMKLMPVNPYLAKNLLVNLAAEFPEFRKIGDWRELTKDRLNMDMINILYMVSYRRTFSRNCEVSLSWGDCLESHDTALALRAFYKSRREGPTLDFYKCYLDKSIPPLELATNTPRIQDFIEHQCGKEGITPGGRHAYFRAIRCFYNWAYSPASGLGLSPADNPITWVKPPQVKRKIMPAQDMESLEKLFSHVTNPRDRAILSTLSDSSGRLTEVSRINEVDILWDKRSIKAVAQGWC